MLLSSLSYAQDAVTAAPKNFKVLAENDKVRVLECVQKKGDQVSMPSHPAHVVYPPQGQQHRFTSAEGEATERRGKTGDVLLLDPVIHAQEALNGSRAIVVELKQ